MAVNTTFDFDQMLSNAREAYGEELLRMADDGLDFVFTYSDNVAPSSSAGKLIAKYPERCFNFGIAGNGQTNHFHNFINREGDYSNHTNKKQKY